MILEFAEHNYIDVDRVVALRWITEQEKDFGVVVLNGDKIAIRSKDQFDAIEKAFIQLHQTHIYNKNGKI